LKGYNIPFLVNDYVDIAVAASADGVHLGQGDCYPTEERATLGLAAIIGQTAFTQEPIAEVTETVMRHL